jgi:MFS transporter, ACS family, glucarate transporter
MVALPGTARSWSPPPTMKSTDEISGELQIDPGAQAGSRVRYAVLAFGVALAAVTYLDRVCIAQTAPQMMRDLNLTDVQMGFVFSAFTLAYALFEIPTGAWGDAIGARRVLTRIVVWWSSFTIATAAAFNFASLMSIRFLFGAGEAGAFPNIAKAFSRWFPTTERGTAQGIFFAGAHLGGGLTPLLVTWLMFYLPWRTIFMLFGAIGFVWAVAWFVWFRDEPAEHPAVSLQERKYIESGRRTQTGHELSLKEWKRLATNRNLIALCAMYFAQGYGFYFCMTWLPTYLAKVRGFSGTKLGFLAGLPLILSAAADLTGGITTDRLIRRFGLRVGRCGVGGVALLVAALAIMAGATTSNPLLSALLIALAGAADSFLLGSCWGVCVDIAGDHAGVVTASMNSFGQLGGALSPIVLAMFVERHQDWWTPLYLIGLLWLAGALCWFLIDPEQPIFDDAKPPPEADIEGSEIDGRFQA